jgi:AI-2 transport protein TqsA
MSQPAKPTAVLIAVGALILIGGALSVARTVFAPIAFALFVIAIVWPFQSRLQAAIPRAVALAVTITVTTVVITAFASLTAWGFSRAVRYVLNDAARFQALYGQMSDWLEGHGIILAGLWAEHFNVTWLIRLLPGITNRINGTTTFLVVVLIYVILGLLEVEDFARKLAMEGREIGRVLLVGGIKTAAKLRRYMLVRTLMSALTGVLVSALAAFTGLELQLEWGVIAFALNYIPVIGPLIATVFPTLFALAQFASWQTAVIIFLLLNVIQFLVGSYLEPRVTGSALSISPAIVLFAVFFWTFLWGISGAFIGVPIMIAVLTICEQHPASRWIADLLGRPAEGPR